MSISSDMTQHVRASLGNLHLLEIRIHPVCSANQLAFLEMPSIFTRIVEREIPAQILREDSDYLAFLDVRPIREGHTLVIPKTEVPDIFDLPEPLLAGLLPFARPVAHAIQQVTQATRIGMAVIGLEVPHAHLHFVPIDGLHDLDFRRASPASEDDLAATAERIRAALAS
jgi:histidine triad (HIT) family protein